MAPAVLLAVGGMPWCLVIYSRRSGKNESGLPVSEVEAVADEKKRQDIYRMISEAEGVSHIEFW